MSFVPLVSKENWVPAGHEAGMLTVGSGDQVVRLLPPFNTTAAEAEEALDKIEGVAKIAAG